MNVESTCDMAAGFDTLLSFSGTFLNPVWISVLLAFVASFNL